MTKVIHVHLLYEKKNYYFGSLSAIFDVLTESEVGITKSSLLHAGMTDGSCKITKRAMIIQSHRDLPLFQRQNHDSFDL